MLKGIELWHNHDHSWLVETNLSAKKLSEDQLLIRAIHSLVSTGTERLVLTTKLDEKTSKRMSLPLMQGSFNNDFTYGYSLTGIIEKGPDHLIGKCVHLLHPHQSYAIVLEQDITIIPDSLAKKGVLLSNLETVINAVWDAGIEMGDEVLIIGYGTIGALLAQVIGQMPGVSLKIHDTDARKQKLASKFEAGNKTTDFDIIFHTSASSEGLQFGIDHLRKEGTLVEMSWYGTHKVEVSLGQSFHYGRKKIISSQVSSIPLKKVGRWSYSKRKDLAIRLLDILELAPLIEANIPFSEAESFYMKLRSNQINHISTIINY